MDTVLETVASDAPSLTNARVEAEEITDVAEKFGVFMVPTFLFVENGKVIDKLEGAVTAELSSKAMKLAGTGAEPSQAAFSRPAVAPAVVAEERVSDERLKELINRKHVMLFMKGTPSAPRCGFSSKVVAALRGAGADFGSFDILSDQAVRQGLKEYSNWPTYPQLYVGGELLGGCDIILEMAQTGELAQEVGMPLSVTRDAFKRMKALLAQETSKGVAHLFVLGTLWSMKYKHIRADDELRRNTLTHRAKAHVVLFRVPGC